MNTLITIGREFGSGGREFGRRLAEQLNIEYYDKEIITEIANHTSFSEEYIKSIIESKPHNLFPITVGQSISYVNDYAFKQIQTVYTVQNKILIDLAQKSDCVIVGRCADYILRDFKPYRIFIHADIESRVARCLERASEDETYTPKQMRNNIKTIDKNRSKYYGFYTGQKWGSKENYDMCINTTDTVIKDIVPVIAKIFM